MAVELQFQRTNRSTPWGFRLTGGADLDLPLTVIKVVENSIAENVGMKVGDLLVRVGDTPTAGLTHLQAHDLIKTAGDVFIAVVIRGELPEFYTETEQTFDSETTQDGISQSLQINIKANVVDKTEIIVESDEVIEKNIKINGSVVSDQQDKNIDITLSTEETKEETTENVSETIEKTESVLQVTETCTEQQVTTNEEKDILAMKLEKLMEPPECIKESEVLRVINEEKIESKESKLKQEEKRWTTFLQKPKTPKPKIKQKETEESKTSSVSSEGRDEHFLFTRLLSVVQEPPYRVIIQKQKKKRDEEKEKAKEISSQGSTPLSNEMLAETPELTSEQEQELRDNQEMQEFQQNEEEMKNNESEQQTEEFEQTEEPVVNEVEMSLEEQLNAIQRQLLALTQLPAAIQQTLDAVTQQLTKIVGPVNDPNTEEKELEQEDFQNTSIEETDRETEKTDALETLEEVSESGFDNSQQGDQDQISQEEDNKTEPELEMLQSTPEPSEENLTPEEREARKQVEKKQKEQQDLMQDLRSRRIKDRPTYPLTPLQRPICLPGGKKWHAPDDAHPSPLHRHKEMSDDLIAETISAQTEILVGTTLGDANTHLVPSKAVDTNKINFLKYQPPPKTLDHLKNSEVFKMIHEMDQQPLRGVGARQGKAMAEEDYYSQMRQEGQMKG